MSSPLYNDSRKPALTGSSKLSEDFWLSVATIEAATRSSKLVFACSTVNSLNEGWGRLLRSIRAGSVFGKIAGENAARFIKKNDLILNILDKN